VSLISSGVTMMFWVRGDSRALKSTSVGSFGILII
jgi:hypothetical protein